jgi:hypothetical protein
VCRLLLIADLLAESPTSSDPNIRSGLLSGGHASRAPIKPNESLLIMHFLLKERWEKDRGNIWICDDRFVTIYSAHAHRARTFF